MCFLRVKFCGRVRAFYFLNLLSYFFSLFSFPFLLLLILQLNMTFLTAVQRMAPTAVKRVATASVKPATIALTQKRFNSTSGTEVTEIHFFFSNHFIDNLPCLDDRS